MRITRHGYGRRGRRNGGLQLVCNAAMAALFGMYLAGGMNAGWWM